MESKKNEIRVLRSLYIKARDLKRTRTVHTLINEFGIKFSSRMIQEEYECSIYTFVDSDELFEEFFSRFSLSSLIVKIKELVEMETEIRQGSESEPETEKEIEPHEGLAHTKDDVCDSRENLKEFSEVKVEKNSVSAGLSLNLPIGDIIKEAVKSEAPEIAKALSIEIKEHILKAAKELKPSVIKINERVVGEIKGKMHSQFKEALQVLNIQKKIYMCGDTGTGKTKMAEQFAKALGLRFESLNLSAGIAEGHLTGRQDIQGNFLTSGFVDLYENGGLFLLDEVDSADANTLLVLNTALSNGKLPVPLRKENRLAIQHDNFYVVCCGNTWGDGADERFTGREYLDEAFKDRFASSKVLVEYDKKLERSLLAENIELCDALHKMRNNAKKNNVSRTISTRLLVDSLKYSLAGISNEDIITKRIVCDYTQEEKNKMLEGVSF